MGLVNLGISRGSTGPSTNCRCVQDWNTLPSLLESNVDPDSIVCESHNSSALYSACQASRIDIVELLVTNKHKPADVNHRNSLNITPIHVAIRKKNVCMVRLLLHKAIIKADLRANVYWQSHLVHAMRQKSVGMVNELLSAGADVSESKELLMEAVTVRNPDICSLLVEHGCDMYASRRDSDEDTDILKHAINFMADECFVRLLEWGYDIYQADISKSMFTYAANKGALDIMCMLINLMPDCLQVDWLVRKQYPVVLLLDKPTIATFRTRLEVRRGEPRSVQHFCRLSILRVLCGKARRTRSSIPQLIDRLNIPDRLRGYLNIPALQHYTYL